MQLGYKPICRNCLHNDGYNPNNESKCCRVDGLSICSNKRCRCWNDHFESRRKYYENIMKKIN